MRSIRAHSAIALNTFREAVRNKLFGSLIFFAVLMLVFTIALGELSLHHEARVARNLTFYTTSLFTMIIAVYASVTLVHAEIDKRTIYTILSKPIHRWEFLLGKFVGIQLLLGVILVALFCISAAIIVMQGGEVSAALAWGHLTLALQLGIITAVALLLASFSSPLLSGLVAVAVFIAGNLMSQLERVRELLQDEGNPLWWVISAMEALLPNLEALNLAEEVAYSLPIHMTYIGSAVWYAASYTAIVLVLAMLIFARRDFV